MGLKGCESADPLGEKVGHGLLWRKGKGAPQVTSLSVNEPLIKQRAPPPCYLFTTWMVSNVDMTWTFVEKSRLLFKKQRWSKQHNFQLSCNFMCDLLGNDVQRHFKIKTPIWASIKQSIKSWHRVLGKQATEEFTAKIVCKIHFSDLMVPKWTLKSEMLLTVLGTIGKLFILHPPDLELLKHNAFLYGPGFVHLHTEPGTYS